MNDELKGKTIKLVGYNKNIGMQSVDVIFNITEINVRYLERVDMIRPPKQDYIYLRDEDDSCKVLGIKQIIAKNNNNKQIVILTNCKVYVMNEEGKTIDTL